jgi:UDP-N-acetylglucosamine 2-epimerase (non-hydrolysing)
MSKKIITVVGTRPNLIKITQFFKEAEKQCFDLKIVHTGQHFDKNMNDVFFDELEMPLPNYSMNVDKTSVITQMAGIMVELEKICKEFKPDLIAVVGDVNSTFAAALVANKLSIPLAHIESGLRSYDNEMPEEHNRILTDAITNYYFITEEGGRKNLLGEGKPETSLFMVGNTMIDTLVAFDAKIEQSVILEKLNLQPKSYILLTMHRPGNVDFLDGLQKLLALIQDLSNKYKIVFPIHPRTLQNLKKFGLEEAFISNPNLILLEPAGYLDFQKMIKYSAFVITDSGGIQEETTFRQIPCITLRPNTERPSTIELGSNVLMDFDLTALKDKIAQIENGTFKKGTIPPMWDGKATERIFEVLNKIIT